MDQFLESHVEIHKLEIEKLRTELSKWTFGVIKYKLASKDRDRAGLVEHFLQNEILKTRKMEEFYKMLYV